MQNTPGDYLIQQFNTLKAMFEDKLLIESIEPSYTNKLFTYSNTVPYDSSRSSLSAKYFNSCKQYLAILRTDLSIICLKMLQLLDFIMNLTKIINCYHIIFTGSHAHFLPNFYLNF